MEQEKRHGTDRSNETECIKRVITALNHGPCYKIERCNCNIERIKRFFKTIKVNENHDKFPDFYFDGGFIEHFAVYSYKTDPRKGNEFEIERFCRDKEDNKEFKEQLEEFLKDKKQEYCVGYSASSQVYDSGEYGNLLDNIKNSILHHLDSLNKSKYKNRIKIFLIEQRDARLQIYNDALHCVFYTISIDKNLLLWLKENASCLDYIIFNCADSIEIIEIKNIDFLIAFSRDDLCVSKGKLIETKTNFVF